ncbi:MAG: hypothetical protein KGN84_07595 [Acidobacteriota bacterium]|nr:hypothetical protein [Acidobacteriota bacterium]
MDPDVRSSKPGKCPRCGMTLEAGIQEPLKYRLNLTVTPRQVPAGKPVELRFELIDPRTDIRAAKFQIVHEKLFHLFLVSSDLGYFVHDHPVAQPDGSFLYRTTLPKPGIYRLLADAYPAGGTPQLLPVFLTTAGYDKSIAQSTAQLEPDLSTKQAANMKVSLRTDPPVPIPGKKTMLFFHVDPGDGLEPYIGAWGHLLAVSNDLVDTIHEHPIYANGGPDIQFNLFFPRAANYKVWVQFQRKGVVNTASFVVPVKELR